MKVFIKKVIGNGYYRANYSGVDVIFKEYQDTYYINATKICSLDGSRYSNLSQNKEYKNLLQYFKESDTGIPAEVPITGDSKISGTYVHPDILPSVLSWISPEFALKANRIVNDFFIQSRNKELE